jgi:predicted cupin superfamily sugar epimerase
LHLKCDLLVSKPLRSNATCAATQRWANNMSDHVHYHHAGGTLIYNIVLPDGSLIERRLGSNIAAGDEPQLVVTGGCFKSVRLEEGAEFGVIGEGVAPGFDFRDFKFVSKHELKALNAEAFEKHHDLVKPDPESEFDHYYEETK